MYVVVWFVCDRVCDVVWLAGVDCVCVCGLKKQMRLSVLCGIKYACRRCGWFVCALMCVWGLGGVCVCGLCVCLFRL